MFYLNQYIQNKRLLTYNLYKDRGISQIFYILFIFIIKFRNISMYSTYTIPELTLSTFHVLHQTCVQFKYNLLSLPSTFVWDLIYYSGLKKKPTSSRNQLLPLYYIFHVIFLHCSSFMLMSSNSGCYYFRSAFCSGLKSLGPHIPYALYIPCAYVLSSKRRHSIETY